MTDTRRAAGAAGEDAAARYLAAAGMTVLERGYRSGRGEIDIIARDGDELVIAEVKTSRSRRYGDPVERVDARKRRQLARLARAYVAGTGREDAPVRFDVLGVMLGPDGRAGTIEHIRNAFETD